MKTLSPRAGNDCFGCGADNTLGLQLTFQCDPEKVTAWTEFDPPAFLAGGAGMMHGGFISLLLDEVSSKVLSAVGKRGLTRHIEISFEKPVPLSQSVFLEAELTRQDGRKHFIAARILNSEKEVLAKSDALFLVFGQ